MERWRNLAERDRALPGAEVPVVLAVPGLHGPVIHAVGDAATARGVQPGARVVDVQAIHPDLHVEPADPNGDVAMLDRLTFWTRRWCPWTARDNEGLLLDATGSTHLFGGDAALLSDMTCRFAMQGLTARVAMAPTRMAAQAFARYGEATTIARPQTLARDLASLPVRALRLEPDIARLLDRLGIKTIGALAAVPRAALMRRFSKTAPATNPLVLLDRAMNLLPDPLDPPPDAVRYIVRTKLAEPVMNAAPHLAELAERLCAGLARAELGARTLRLTIYRVDGNWRAADVATARASRDAAHLLRLLHGKLDKVDPGFGFDLLTLEAMRVEPLALRQERIDDIRDPDDDVAALLDRLTARLGRDRVNWSAWSESHLPERVQHQTPALTMQPALPPEIAAERPLRLLDMPEEVHVLYALPEGPPMRFRWRRVQFTATRHSGPERIAPEWWRDRPGTRLRDYYKVEVEDGRRFWLYREGLAGDGRGDAPRWFLHGLFA